MQHDTDMPTFYSSRYHRWHEELRPYLFSSIQYVDISNIGFPDSFPKIESEIESRLWSSLVGYKHLRSLLTPKNTHTIYYHNSPRYWIRAMTFVPYFWNERDGEQISTQVKPLYVATKLDASVVAAALNSSATLFAVDIAKRIRPSTTDRQQIRYGRIAAVVVMLLAMLWSTQGDKFSSIFEAINKIASAIAPPVTTVFLFGVFSKRGNNKAAIATLIAGLVLGITAFCLDF